MSSRATPGAQTYATCFRHRPGGGGKKYVAAVGFAGDGLAVVCGNCKTPAVLWMTNAAWRRYQAGERHFGARTFGVTLKAGETVLERPN